MMRIIHALLPLLIFTAVADAENTPVKVGAIYSMSGSVAKYGKWAANGARLAASKAEYPVEIVLEDSAGEGSKGVSAYQKLRSIDQVAVVSTLISSVALAVKPLAAQQEVVQIDISATAPSYSEPNGFQFRTGINAEQLAASAAHYIRSTRGISTVGCLHIENAFGEGMYRVFEQKFDGEISIVETFRKGDSDFRPALLKLKKAKVPAIWLVGHARESGLILQQARQLGMTLPFISDVYSIETPDFLEGTQNPGDLVYLAPSFDPDSSTAEVKEFVELYKKQYDEEPTVYAAQAYDAILSLGKALKRCNGPKKDCLPRELRKLNFTGASGNINFDVNGNVHKDLEIKFVSNGHFLTKSEFNH